MWRPSAQCCEEKLDGFGARVGHTSRKMVEHRASQVDCHLFRALLLIHSVTKLAQFMGSFMIDGCDILCLASAWFLPASPVDPWQLGRPPGLSALTLAHSPIDQPGKGGRAHHGPVSWGL